MKHPGVGIVNETPWSWKFRRVICIFPREITNAKLILFTKDKFCHGKNLKRRTALSTSLRFSLSLTSLKIIAALYLTLEKCMKNYYNRPFAACQRFCKSKEIKFGKKNFFCKHISIFRVENYMNT